MAFRIQLPLTLLLLIGMSRGGLSADGGHQSGALERSFWLHASLAPVAQKGYWGPDYPDVHCPSEADVRNAARILTETCAANRLYLIYHAEIPQDDAAQVFAWWRRHCPARISLVPTLVLRMYDEPQTPVFTAAELRRLAKEFQQSINTDEIAVYDVHAHRHQGEALKILADLYPKGLIRVGLQPDEKLEWPFISAVQDTWGGFSHGKSNADWQDKGFGAETLRKWVADRNQQPKPIAWDLIAVAWDYAVTERGGYPGYDDAAKNMPLPAGRNRLGAAEILRVSKPGVLSGFSSDLLILQVNSENPAHDGRQASFYEVLKQGQPYKGYYSVPFQEIAEVYRELRDDKFRAHR